MRFVQGKFKLMMILCNILNNYKTESKLAQAPHKADDAVIALFTRIYKGIPDYYHANQHDPILEFFSFSLCFFNLIDEYEI